MEVCYRAQNEWHICNNFMWILLLDSREQQCDDLNQKE